MSLWNVTSGDGASIRQSKGLQNIIQRKILAITTNVLLLLLAAAIIVNKLKMEIQKIGFRPRVVGGIETSGYSASHAIIIFIIK
jgi:hypothetical protein